MYDYIRGELAELHPTHAVVEAGGVGYAIGISLSTHRAIEGSKTVKLFIHSVLREDAHTLYGFATPTERELFRALISVSGVGGGTARQVLSTFSETELRQIILQANAALLKNVKGLGLKTAQKIIVDLGGKLADMDGLSKIAGADEAATEAVSALTMLGFARTAAEKAVAEVRRTDANAQVEELVRAALKKI